MALPQHKTCLSILRSILGPGAGNEARFAKKIGRSISWLTKASCGQIPLTEDAAVRIGYETGINVRWLMAGDATKPPVDKDRQPYTLETYAAHREAMREGLDDKEAAANDEDIAAILRKILQSYVSARKQKRGGLFTYHLQNAGETLLLEFGSDDIKESPLVAHIVENLQNLVEGGEDFHLLYPCTDQKWQEEFLENYQKEPVSAPPTKTTPQKKQPSRKSKRPA